MVVVSITREELHRIVWHKPMPELALALGLTSPQLVEICETLKVPFPHAQYWKRLRAGERVVKFELPKPDPKTPEQLTLSLEPWAHKALDTFTSTVIFEAVERGEHEPLPKLHPIIRVWHKHYQELRRQYKSDRGAFHWSACDLRKHRILDRIFRAVEVNGYSIEADRRKNDFTLFREDTRLHFRLREHRSRIVIPRSSGVSYDLKPSGKLHFEIRFYSNPDFPIPKEWKDTDEHDLEAMTPELISTLLQAGEALSLYQRLKAERDRKSKEHERLRCEDEAQRRADRNLWSSFLTFADRPDAAVRTERFITMLEQSFEDRARIVGDRSIAEWLSWARSHLAEFESQTHSPTWVFQELVRNFNRPPSP